MELFESLDAVERDAAGALDRARQPVLFDRLSWFRLLQAHSPPPGRLLVARALDHGGKRAWLFLAVRNRSASAYANWYTLRFGLIVEEGADDSCHFATAIARTLREHGVVRVELYPARSVNSLMLSFGKAGWRSFAHTRSSNWVADVARMSFADYWAQRPGNLRNIVARHSRSAALDVTIHNDFDPLIWSKYEQIYSASWKPEEGSPAFLRALAKQEGAAGTLRLGIGRSGGQAVAAQFWLVENRRATIHKLAHREDARALSPGTLLSTAMFRHVIDVDRVTHIDFGLGDEPFKADWMDHREPVKRTIAYDPRTLAGAAGAVRELVRRVRND